VSVDLDFVPMFVPNMGTCIPKGKSLLRYFAYNTLKIKYLQRPELPP